MEKENPNPAPASPSVEPMAFKTYTSQSDLTLGDVRTGAYVFAHGSIKAKSIHATGKIESETGSITAEGDIVSANIVKARHIIQVGGKLKAKEMQAKRVLLGLGATMDVESVFAEDVAAMREVREGDKTVIKEIHIPFRQGGRLKV